MSRSSVLDEFEALTLAQFRKAKVVTFDLFDTLVVRQLGQPSDAFEQALRDFGPLQTMNGLPVSPLEAVRNRALAERSARNLAWEIKRGVEVRQSDIFEVLHFSLGISRSDADELMALELNADVSSWMVDLEAVRLLEAVKSFGTRVGVISDTYLSRDDVVAGLDRLGVLKSLDFVYVSSEFDATKAYGNLWTVVRREEKVPDEELWVHLGDNVHSDVNRAREAGVLGFEWPRVSPWPVDPIKHLRGGLTKFDGIQRRRSTTTPLSERGRDRQDLLDAEVVATSVLAPLLSSLTIWLLDSIESTDASQLWAFSRDGFLIDRILREWRSGVVGERPVRYVNVSRRTLSLASIDGLHDASLDLILSGNWETSGKAVARRLGLPQTLIRQLPETVRGPLGGAGARQEMRDWLRRYEAEVLEAIGQLRSRTIRYLLEQLGDSQYIALFDLGWHGTLQESLTRMLPSLQTDGYYLGLLEPSIWRRSARAKMFGLVSGGFESTVELNSLKSVVPLLESLFLAPEGSTWDYTSDGLPVQISSGFLMDAYLSRVSPIQQSTLLLLAELGEVEVRNLVGGKSQALAKSVVSELVWSAPKSVVRQFLDFPHVDGIEHEDMGVRLVHDRPRSETFDLGQARQSGWPSGQLRWWAESETADITGEVELVLRQNWG